MSDVPVDFAWPMHFERQPDGTLVYALVEQHTTADLTSRAAIVASTPRGHRDDDPTFGVTDPTFGQGGADAERYAAELAQSDGALDVDARDVADLADQAVRDLQVAVRAAADTGATV